MRQTKQLKIVKELLIKMNESLNYCHWKSNQHFDDALYGIDDLDILIDREQYSELNTILQKLNFKKFYTPSSRAYVGIEDFLGFDYETGKIIHLHLHCQLMIGEKHLKGFHFPIEKDILKNRRFDRQNDVYMSSYFDELLLLILRIGMKVRKRDIIKKNLLSKSTENELFWLKEKCPNFIDKIDEISFLKAKTKKYIVEIYNGNLSWSMLTKLKYNLYASYSPYSQGNCIHNTFLRHYREICRIIQELRKKVFYSKYTFLRRRSAIGGVIFAFLGSDGAGKSSTIKEIQKWLINVMDVRYFYLGSGVGSSSNFRSFLKIFKRLAEKIGIIKATNNFSDEDFNIKKKRKGISIKSYARKLWIYSLSNERIKKIKAISRCKNKGFVVLTDRYPQSEYVGLCDGPKLSYLKGIASKKEKKSFEFASLVFPDIAIKFIVSPEVAMKRKPNEINYEVSRKLTEKIKKINFSNSTKKYEIDADKPHEEVILEVKRIIWENI